MNTPLVVSLLSLHTKSCFHRLCSMHVCYKIRQLWVDRGDGLWILVSFPWPKNLILGLVFTAYVPCCIKRQLWVDRGDGLWILVPFPWPKNFILVPCCKIRQFLVRQGRWFVDFRTVPVTQSFHTRSCFHRLWCCMHARML